MNRRELERRVMELSVALSDLAEDCQGKADEYTRATESSNEMADKWEEAVEQCREANAAVENAVGALD